MDRSIVSRVARLLAALRGFGMVSAQARPRVFGARAAGRFAGRWARSLAALCLLSGLAAPAWAACPPVVTATVASGGQLIFDCAQAGGFDFEVNGPVVFPSHGTLTEGSPTDTSAAVYTNNGDGALSDTFTLYQWESSSDVVFNVTVLPASGLNIDPGSLPAPSVGVFYSEQLTASGGTPSYTFSITSGALPGGLNLSPTGLISGTPTAARDFAFTVTATDSGTPELSGNQSYSFTVPDPDLDITPDAPPSGVETVPYNFSLGGSGGTAPYTFQIMDGGTLQPGLSLAPNGTISGTPAPGSAGSVTVQVRMSDDTSGFDFWVEEDITITIDPPPVITVAPATLPGATVASAYNQTISGGGGTAPYTFAVTAGSLPAGLDLDEDSGAITGTPTAGGSFNFQITATDDNGFPGTRDYTLTVADATVTLAPPTLPAAQVGAAYSATVSASGGTPTYSYAVTAGSLPDGLNLNASSGAITGTPTAGGSFNFTITATDSSTGTGPYTDSNAYTLTVADPNITLAPATLPDGINGTAYSQTITATGGTAGYTFAITAGALPDNLSLSSSGVLSGTPTQSGSFNFTVTATDSSTGTGPYSQPQAYTLTIATAVPTANDVSATVAYGSGANPITLDITGGTPTSVAVASPASHGTAIASGTGITYQPTAGYAGPDSFTYTASNADGTSAPATVTVTVSDPTLAATASGPLDAQVAQAYSVTFTWSGGAAPYSGHNVTGLPAGLAVTASDADSVTVSGTPTAAGSFSLQVTATDSSTGNGPFTETVPFTLDVAAPGLALTPAAGALPDATYPQAYSQSFNASGGTAPYNYVLTGTVPTGLSLGASTGVLSGTADQPGFYNFTVTVTDSSTGPGAPYQVAHNYTLLVQQDIDPGPLTDGTVAVPYSQTVTATGGVAPYTFTMNLGTSLPPGLSLAADGTVSGTPTASGTFSFNIQATDVNNVSGARGYNLTIAAVSIELSPASLPGGTVGAAYAQTLSASGGFAPYSYAVTSGSLPAGLSLAADGQLTGTPTTPGTASFQVTATDNNSNTGSQAYSLVVVDAPPVAVDDSASTLAEQAVTIAATSNDSGVIDTITIADPPAHGSVTVSGLSVVYTPAAGFSGSDSFRYAANGPGGSSEATVTIEVTPLPVPVGQPQTLSTLGGQAVSFDAADGASGGPFTGVAIVEAPADGEVTVEDTVITYTPSLTASGAVAITYTVSNAYGASAPITSTITVNPMPIAAAHRAQVLAGAAVEVELTDNASGGPFTDAAVLSVSPAEAGSASVTRVGDGDDAGYRLTFTAAVDYAGAARVQYTLSNAFATSAAATVTVEVSARPDPTRDAEVMGLLRAQTQSTRRLAHGQIGNFQQRLEALHNGRQGGGFDNGLTVAIDRSCNERDWQVPGSACQRPLADEQAPVLAPAAGGTGMGTNTSTPLFALWASGAMRFGEYDPRRGASGFEFETQGISVGADYRLGPAFALGGGLGYGRDVSDIGEHGSRSEAEAWSAAVYASYHPGEHVYLDGLVGYQWLSFDLRRHLTFNGGQVTGRRDGQQWFASLAAGYQWQRDLLGVTTYARLDSAHATLDGYVEQGDPVLALAMAEQDVDTTTTSLGLRLDYLQERDWGSFAPQLRLEYQHDLDADSVAVMRYADLPNGPFYRAGIDGFDRNRFVIGLGTTWRMQRGLGLQMEYRRVLGNSGVDDQSLQLRIEKQF